MKKVLLLAAALSSCSLIFADKIHNLNIQNSSGQGAHVKVFMPKGHLTGILIKGPFAIANGDSESVKLTAGGSYDVVVDYEDGSHRKIDVYVTGKNRSVIIPETQSAEKQFYRALKEAVESVESED